MQFFRDIWLVSKTIWIEAIRRREIYAIVIVAMALIGGVRMVDFFGIDGLAKFYREISLKTMNVATALTVILLAARQLPREFENRTIYPLLAKPIGRWSFLLGKFVGVIVAAAFCYSLFMVIFLIGGLATGVPLNWTLFGQFLYLQIWNFAVLTSLTYLLSLMFNVDAAITISTLVYLCSQTFLSLMSYIYDYLDVAQQKTLLAFHYLIPQLTLFDASSKVVHSLPMGDGLLWPSIAPWAIFQLTLYGLAYTSLYLGAAYLIFRRRAL